jgi:selenocysteine lyase/cysteine desulfurase
VYGFRLRQAIEDARLRVASFIGAEPDEIVFTRITTAVKEMRQFG